MPHRTACRATARVYFRAEDQRDVSRSRFGDLDDTTPEARAHLDELLRRMTPEERFASALAASRRLREFTYAGLRSHHPDASIDQLDQLYAEAVLPADLYRRFIDATRRRA